MPRTSTIIGVLLFVGLGVAGVVCGGGMLLLGHWFRAVPQPTEPVGTVLVYQLSDADSNDTLVSQRVADLFNRRLSGSVPLLGRAEVIPGGQVQVDVYGSDPARLHQVKSRLRALGTLEFRILANQRDHAELIEAALQSDDAEVHLNNKLVASWAPIRRGRDNRVADGFVDDSNIATRQTGPQRNEVLLVVDPFHVTGKYLSEVQEAYDVLGRPAVSFKFTAQGGELFGAFTSENLPDVQSGFARRLGIVLNGEVFSAPSIQSTIYDEGEITGDFTLDEVAELVAVLNSGALPTPVELVQEQTIIPPPLTPSSKAGN